MNNNKDDGTPRSGVEYKLNEVKFGP